VNDENAAGFVSGPGLASTEAVGDARMTSLLGSVKGMGLKAQHTLPNAIRPDSGVGPRVGSRHGRRTFGDAPAQRSAMGSLLAGE